MKRIAIIKNGSVSNIALWDGQDEWAVDADWLVDVTDRPKAQIGSTYDQQIDIFASELQVPPEE